MDGMETVRGVPWKTTSVSSTDTAQSIPSGSLSGAVLSNGAAEELLIVIETAAVRFGFGGTVPTQAGLGVKVDPGGSIRIAGSAIAGTKFISSGASTPGKLQIVASVV